jgi:hypothetical protein
LDKPNIWKLIGSLKLTWWSGLGNLGSMLLHTTMKNELMEKMYWFCEN